MKPQIALVLCFVLHVGLAQDYSSFQQTLRSIAGAKNPAALDSAWNGLVNAKKIPLIFEDSVAFLYRGEAKSVSWIGDFNGWGYNKSMDTFGKKIAGTNIWILKASFPKDARIDYKIILDGNNWIIDPDNQDQQWSGVGGGSPNSELRMPQWKPDPLTTSLVENAKTGRVFRDMLFNSKMLGYQVTYSVYLPFGYDKSQTYPVVYVTDGYEYMHDRLGNMITVLDNLISLKKIEPIVAVFIDHREPVNRANNRRMQELAMNEMYLKFMTEELVPAVEASYSVSKSPEKTAVIGSSMGGLSAAYFAFAKPNVFGLAGVQSPAFWFRPDIYTLCDNPEKPPVKMFMTSGTMYDNGEGAHKMKAILDKNTCNYKYVEVNQGHSWGNFRDLIDDILIYFFPAG